MSGTIDERVPAGSLAFMLIDMQPDFLGEISFRDKAMLVDSQTEVLRHCAQHDIPVAVVEWEGKDVKRPTIDSLRLEIGHIPRHGYYRRVDGVPGSLDDGFSNPNLYARLVQWGVSQVCLMGINASGCVKSTAQGALDHGLGIATAEQLIAEPKDWNTGKSRQWFVERGGFHKDYSQILSRISPTPVQSQPLYSHH